MLPKNWNSLETRTLADQRKYIISNLDINQDVDISTGEPKQSYVCSCLEYCKDVDYFDFALEEEDIKATIISHVEGLKGDIEHDVEAFGLKETLESGRHNNFLVMYVNKNSKI